MMEARIPFWQFRMSSNRWAWLMCVWGCVLLLGLAMGCSRGESEPVILDNSGEPWEMVDGNCVREAEEGPVRRVINRSDPELCGRAIKNRPPDYIRIQRPE